MTKGSVKNLKYTFIVYIYFFKLLYTLSYNVCNLMYSLCTSVILVVIQLWWQPLDGWNLTNMFLMWSTMRCLGPTCCLSLMTCIWIHGMPLWIKNDSKCFRSGRYLQPRWLHHLSWWRWNPAVRILAFPGNQNLNLAFHTMWKWNRNQTFCPIALAMQFCSVCCFTLSSL